MKCIQNVETVTTQAVKQQPQHPIELNSLVFLGEIAEMSISYLKVEKKQIKIEIGCKQ